VEITRSGAVRCAIRHRPGPTNREIAQTLYVTTRTVEAHLTSAYRKLGIDSRSKLAAALDDATPR
jgi:DNA-binding NarL/FixJ family response regulator